MLAPGQMCPKLWHWELTTWSEGEGEGREGKRREKGKRRQRSIKLQNYALSKLQKKSLVDLNGKLGCRREVAAWT